MVLAPYVESSTCFVGCKDTIFPNAIGEFLARTHSQNSQKHSSLIPYSQYVFPRWNESWKNSYAARVAYCSLREHKDLYGNVVGCRLAMHLHVIYELCTIVCSLASPTVLNASLQAPPTVAPDGRQSVSESRESSSQSVSQSINFACGIIGGTV
jgi:hypothetical protein